MARPRRPEHFWPTVWGGAAALLVVVIFAEHEFGRVTVGEGSRAPAKVVEAKLLPPFALPREAETGPEMVLRPLFVPTRRPAPPATTAAASTMKRGQFVLTGVTVTPDVSVAFLKELANGKTVGVKKGAQINGLTVESVEPRRVVLRQGEESEDLPLNVQVPARVATAPAATAPPVTNLFAPRPPAAGAAPDSGVPAAPGAPQAAGAAPPGTPLPQGAPAAPAVPAVQPGQPPAPAPATGRRRPWMNTQ